MTVLMTLAALVQGTPATDCAIVQFSRSPALRGSSEQVGICRDPDGGPRDAALRRVTVRIGGEQTVEVTSTRACPAVLPHLEALENLAPPAPDVPGIGNDLAVITLDGVGYTLMTPALYVGHQAQLSMSSNVGTPLANWIDAALAALAPCWRAPAGR